MTETSLNDKILKIIDDNIEGNRGGELTGRFDAANKIQKLLLSEKIDLINELIIGNIIINPVSYVLPKDFVSIKISELTSQLNSINNKS